MDMRRPAGREQVTETNVLLARTGPPSILHLAWQRQVRGERKALRVGHPGGVVGEVEVPTGCLGQNPDPPLAEKDLKFQGQRPSGPDAPVSYPVLAPRTRTRPRR